MSNETIGIIFIAIGLFTMLQISTWTIGNRPYSMHYKSHGLVEKKGIIKLIYFKPQHFHRYNITEVISFFMSYFYLLFGMIFVILSELNESLSILGMDILAVSSIVLPFWMLARVIYVEITYRKEEKYRIFETKLVTDDKLINELFKYAGSLRFNLDHLYELKLKKIDPNDKEKIEELDKEYIQYYRDYKKIYVKKNKVYYIE